MILIFGVNGMLGNYMYTYLKMFYDTVGLSRKDFDVYNSFNETSMYNDINDIIKLYKPIYIINCIADILKTVSSKNPNEKYVINSYFPIILSTICKENNIILIHSSTDGIYSGNGSFYNEDTFPDCIDNYGLSKFLGENIHACVIRVSIIGEEKVNMKSLVSWVKLNKNKTVNGYTNHLWNGITCLEYTKFIHTIIKDRSHWIGIKNIVSKYKGNNFITKYELVRTISEIYDLNVDVLKHETEYKCDRTLEGDIIIEKDLYDQIVEMKILYYNMYILVFLIYI